MSCKPIIPIGLLSWLVIAVASALVTLWYWILGRI